MFKKQVSRQVSNYASHYASHYASRSDLFAHSHFFAVCLSFVSRLSLAPFASAPSFAQFDEQRRRSPWALRCRRACSKGRLSSSTSSTRSKLHCSGGLREDQGSASVSVRARGPRRRSASGSLGRVSTSRVRGVLVLRVILYISSIHNL